MGIVRNMTIQEFRARLTYTMAAKINKSNIDIDQLLAKYKKESYTNCDELGRVMSVNNFVKKELG